MRESIKSALPIGILLAGGAVAWALAADRVPSSLPEDAVAPPQVAVLRVETARPRVRLITHGTLTPRTELQLASGLAGRVARLSPRLEAGAFFEAGELLVELDPLDASIALERVRAEHLRAKSELEIARTRRARVLRLVSNSVMSAAQLEDAEHGVAIAEAGLRASLAVRNAAQRDLERTRVVAPFAGRVRSRSVDVGALVSRGTALASVYAIDFAEVRLPIDAADAALLPIPLADAADGARVVLRAASGGVWSARIVRSEGVIDSRTRMLHLVASIEDPFARAPGASHVPARMGQFVEAEIQGRAFEAAAVLPRTALRSPDRVYVVDAEGRMRSRRVEILRIEPERVIVGSGLDVGEQVLVLALGALEGRSVRTVAVETRSAGTHHTQARR